MSRLRNPSRLLPLLAVCLSSFLPSLLAQSDRAVLFGLVTDPSGGSMANAHIILTNADTGDVRELNANSKGLFYFTVLKPGNYRMLADSPGFRQFSRDGLKLQVAQVGRFDVHMDVGSTSESVAIGGNVSALNSETASQGTIVTEEKLPALPLNGRQFIQLALLVPGVNPGGRAVQQNALRQGQIGGLSIAGNRTNNTLFLLDGAVNVDPDYSSLNYSPPVDAIAEFQVQTAMAGAEYPTAAINVVTKSGTNTIHGGAWEFLRNRDLDARPFNLNSNLPQFQRSQFGGIIGGPLVKNRLFGFGSFEGLDVHQAGAGLTTVTVPSILQRQNDFSRTKGGIFDPATLTGGIRQPFPNFQIPASRLNPLSLAAMLALPLPTDPATSSFVNANGLLLQNNKNYSARFDYTATTNWTLFARYSLSDEAATVPQTLPGRDISNNGRSQHAVIGSTYVLNESMVNETRLGFSRLNLLSGLPEPVYSVGGAQTTLPQFNVAGFPLMGGAGGFNTTNAGGGIALSRNNNYEAYDNFAWTKGRHSIKIGGSVNLIEYNRFEAVNAFGNYQFTSGFTTRTAKTDGTGDPLASFLLGLPAIGTRSVGPSRIDGRQQVYAAYIQDNYRILPNLTLNLGLRYELAPPLYDAHQQMSSIDYSHVPTPGTIFAQGKTAFYMPTLFVCGQSGYPKGCANTDYNNFAPRAGIVWSAGPKTVIRAGGGIFYANSDANPLFRLAAGLPDNIAQTLNSDNFVPRFQGYDIFGPAVVGPVQIQAAGIDLNQRTSYSIQWNFSVQRELRNNVVIEAGYMATLGLKLEQNVQPNNAAPGAGAVDPRRPYAGLQFASGTQFPPYITVVGNSVPVGQINYLPHSAQSNYHAGFARVEKRFSGGLSFLGAYTFSKAITNAPQFRNAGGVTGSENSPPQNSYDLSAERGLASFHVAQRGVATVLYELPFGHGGRWVKTGWASKVLEGMEISSIVTAQTGFPFTVNLRGDTAGAGAGTGGIFVRPNAAPGVSSVLGGSDRTTDRWFNTAAFLTPAAFTFGNVGRNTVIGPGLTNFDVEFSKNIRLTEAAKLQLRAEFFNALNHPNYNLVGRILNDPTFGRVLSQLDPRQVQVAAKFLF